MKKSKKKGFTLIELIVVIAILGILVLLATPKFLGYTKDANDIRIANDIMVYETVIHAELAVNPEFNKHWLIVKNDDILMLNESKKLYNKKKEIVNNLGGQIYVIQDVNVNSSLKGTFLLNNDEVFYYEGTLEGISQEPEENLKPSPQEHFTWVSDSSGYTAVKQSGKGYYKYIGTGEEVVVIPHVIDGTEMTSYYKMFSDTNADVKKVVSTNPNVTDMRSMFRESRATSLDLSSFDTSKVANMSFMFSGSQAKSLDLSSFDTSEVTNMAYMFSGSQAMAITFGEKFNTSKVTNMSSMFSGSQATSLDLSSFDTSEVTDMESMFYGSQATAITFGEKFNTSKVTNMFSMFLESQATSLDLSSFDTREVTDMSSMFENAKATSLDLSSFDTSKVTDMNYMLYGSEATTGYAKTQADADKFNNESITGKPIDLTFTVKGNQ